MHNYPYKLVDVFTDTPLEGNQLAVVFEAEGLSDQILVEIVGTFFIRLMFARMIQSMNLTLLPLPRRIFHLRHSILCGRVK